MTVQVSANDVKSHPNKTVDREKEKKRAQDNPIYEEKFKKFYNENEEFQKVFNEKKDVVDRSWYERLAVRVLEAGPVPAHIAFIMDGNRRYARQNKLGSVLEGHKEGSKKLAEVSS